MNKKKEIVLTNIVVGKLVHGGQAIAEISQESAEAVGRADLAGRKIFLWNALPGEVVDVRVTKKKSSYLEGIATTIHTESKDRIEPLEPLSYLSTSPWQMMTWEAENTAKQSILAETFEREGVKAVNFAPFVFDEPAAKGKEQPAAAIHSPVPRDEKALGFSHKGYRNKQEIGFWGDDNGLHLAHYVRGTHGKQIVESSSIAADAINTAQIAVRDELRKHDVWAGDLKTVTMRCSANGDTVAALFCKKELDLSSFSLPKELQGMDIYYSNPQSPASVPTKKLYSFGDTTLTDTIHGKEISYYVLSFFQVNIPIFEQALQQIIQSIGDEPSIDMYSGVGSIGISVGSSVLIESDPSNIVMAKKNVHGTNTEVVHATSETALEYIDNKNILIVDPPRAGLHKNVIDRIRETKPPKVVYLSCNPSTQSRDVVLLQDHYDIEFAQGYNFFPRTPHIESLIVMRRK